MSQASKIEPTATEPEPGVERDESTATVVGTPAWQRGVVGGILGGLIAAAVFSISLPAHIETTLPGLYGLEGGVAGWFVMVSHAAILGLVYGAIASVDGVREFADSLTTGTALGILFGAIAAVAVGDALVPYWAEAMNVADAPAVLSFEPVVYGAYVAFGLVLGLVVAGLALMRMR